MVESNGPIHAMTALFKIVTIMNHHQVFGGLSGEGSNRGTKNSELRGSWAAHAASVIHEKCVTRYRQKPDRKRLLVDSSWSRYELCG
jgi:hypothetical protein